MSPRWCRQQGQSPWLMGVLNCTPDSFSDSNLSDADYLAANKAYDVTDLVKKARQLQQDGAHIIDVGGESTRPGAKAISVEDELARVIPVIQALSTHDMLISIDTMKADVMYQAIQAGATMVNDVSALTADAASLEVVADAGVDVCLMHMLGTPATMQEQPKYQDVLDEVAHFFAQRIEACVQAGIEETQIILDVGIGFGKRLEDNLALITRLQQLKTRFSLPLLLGTSRKSFLGAMTGADVHNRELETAVTSAIGVFCGADMLRVHDCKTHRKTAIVAAQLADAAHEVVC
ncbi:MAG: dihydropteroate synthase [Mariprofundaceae bacterium]|nr:dihydropteroate synthase [Mariprofundaceae bacterium]